MKFAVSRPPSGFSLLMDAGAATAIARLQGETEPTKGRVFLSQATRHDGGGYTLTFGLRQLDHDERPVATIGKQASDHWPLCARWSHGHATRLLPFPMHGLYEVPDKDYSLDAKGLMLALPSAEKLPAPVMRNKARRAPTEEVAAVELTVVSIVLPSGPRAYRVPLGRVLELALDWGEAGYAVKRENTP